jgi:hypothetical protein
MRLLPRSILATYVAFHIYLVFQARRWRYKKGYLQASGSFGKESGSKL